MRLDLFNHFRLSWPKGGSGAASNSVLVVSPQFGIESHRGTTDVTGVYPRVDCLFFCGVIVSYEDRCEALGSWELV